MNTLRVKNRLKMTAIESFKNGIVKKQKLNISIYGDFNGHYMLQLVRS